MQTMLSQVKVRIWDLRYFKKAIYYRIAAVIWL